MARKHIIRKQRQRRRAGAVRRIEIVLDMSDPEHATIAEYLDTLPRGETSEYVRQAVLTRMAAEYAPEPEPVSSDVQQDDSASAAFNAILAELVALRALVGAANAVTRQPEPVAVSQNHQAATAPPPAATGAPGQGSSPGVVESSGIDMSGPPRRRATVASSPPPTLPEIEPPFDPEATARLLVQSIMSYGKETVPAGQKKRGGR